MEAHGTGTSLGDPIEIAGLERAFDPDGEPEQACAIGSVKSNIGHLEAAAGIAGLTKTLLQMKHRIKVPSLHSEVENQNLDFDDSSFYLQKKVAFWSQPTVQGVQQERRAMVSSFGAGGSNAHLIVSEFPDTNARSHRTEARPENGGIHFPFSAQSRQALIDYLHIFSRFLADKTSHDMFDMACTLQEGRHAMEHRVLLTAASVKELNTKIQQYLASADSDGQDSANVNEIELLDLADQRALLSNWLLSGDLAKVQRFWEFGGYIDWTTLFGLREYKKAELPTYQFDRKEFRMQRTSVAANRVQTFGTAVTTDGSNQVVGYSIKNLSSLYRHLFELRPFVQFNEAQSKQNHAESNTLITALAEICRRATETDAVFDIDKSKLAELDRGTVLTVEVTPLFEGDGLNALELNIDTLDASGIVLVAQPVKSTSTGVFEPGSDQIHSTQNSKQVLVTHKIPPEQVKKTDKVSKPSDAVINKPMNVTLRALPVSRSSEAERLHVGLVNTSGEKTDRRGKPTVNSLDMEGLKASLAACLFMEPGDIDETTTFSDIGLDSIVGLEWIDGLSKAHGIQLDTSALYDYPTLLAFRDYINGLFDHCNGAEFISSATAPPTPNEPAGFTTSPESVKTESSKDISSVLLDELANVLYMDRSDVQMDTVFAEIGLDSVVGLEWLDKVNCQLGLALSTTVLYDYPSVRQLARHVEEGLEQGLYVHLPRGSEPALQLIHSDTPEFDSQMVSG
ncbi:MAG: phosphopantetheine-binding protein [Candidatus Thiodiazotropha sp.]